MLREILPTKQVNGEPRRRWFYSKNCDLILWLDQGDCPVGFQLCYDKEMTEHAFTWKEPDQFIHTGMDAGEVEPLLHKSSPLLAADGSFDGARLVEVFRLEAAELPREYFELVLGKIQEYERRAAQRKA